MATNLVPGLIVCVLSSLVISCNSTGKISRGHEARSKIFVLRRLSVLGGGGIAISDNGKSVGTIHRGGIVVWDRPPGTFVVSATGASEAKVTLTVQPNEVYYLETRATHRTPQHPRVIELHVLSQSEGLHLLRTLEREFPGS
jgi:hypothetical protein